MSEVRALVLEALMPLDKVVARDQTMRIARPGDLGDAHLTGAGKEEMP